MHGISIFLLWGNKTRVNKVSVATNCETGSFHYNQPTGYYCSYLLESEHRMTLHNVRKINRSKCCAAKKLSVTFFILDHGGDGKMRNGSVQSKEFNADLWKFIVKTKINEICIDNYPYRFMILRKRFKLLKNFFRS